MPRYEFVEGSSSKFWEIEISGASVTTRWGRIGTAGQEKTKDFASSDKAQAEYDSLIREKTGKGYRETGASSAPAPPAPRPAPASPPPPAAAPPVPEPPPQPVSSATAATEEPGIAWTPELRALVLPRRGGEGRPAAASDPAAAWSRIREVYAQHAQAWKSSQSLRDPDLAQVLRAVLQKLDHEGDGLPPAADPEIEGALLVVLSIGDSWQQLVLGDEIVTLWEATAGLAFAVEALQASLGFEAASQSSQRTVWLSRKRQGGGVGANRRAGTRHWWYLRHRLAAAPEAKWEEARATAERLREGAYLSCRIPLAYLFPETGWAEDDAREVLDRGHDSQWMGGMLMPVVRDAALVSRLIETSSFGWIASPSPLADPWRSLRNLAATLLDNLGTEAAGPLVRIVERCDVAEPRRLVLAALEAVGTPAAAEALAERLDVREVMVAMSSFGARHPHLALQALAARAGRGAPAVVSLLSQMVRRNPELAAELSPGLPEAARRAVAAALDVTEIPAEAAPADLPPVLASPPWQRKGKRKEPPPSLDLPPLAWEETMVWPDGEKERWNRAPAYGSLYGVQLTNVAWEKLDDAALRKEAEKIVSQLRYATPSSLASYPSRLGLALWETVPPAVWYGGDRPLRFLAVQGLRALPGLLRYAGVRLADAVPLFLPFRVPRLAPLAAEALARLKSARAEARRWLLAHDECAAAGLIPDAVGPAGKKREMAGAALRLLAANGREAQVLDVAGRWGEDARAAVRAVLDVDPLDLLPARLPKMPAFWQPEAFARPLLRGRTAALPLPAVEALGTILAISPLDEPYAGLEQVREACDPASLGAFAWDLFSAWMIAGAPSKDQWALQALGHLGDDACARRLAPLVRQWPGESAHARAVTGLDVLRAIGTDVALMHLHGISQKLKFKGLQEKAQEKIAEVAEQRGLTPEDLADRLVPDLGLGADGSLVLDLGPRSFRVGFDEALKPFVRDAEGKRLPDLPKPGKADDPEKAGEAQETWKALKKDAKALAAHQIVRLELAMCSRRRWEPDVFRTFFLEHPLLQHLVRRLIWGVWDAGDALAATFRVSEDGSLADVEDEAWELPDGGRIGIVHRLDLTPEQASRWGEVLADYEILQPFAQIGRELYPITEAEKSARELQRVEGLTLSTGKVLGLVDQRGWRRGPPMDAGWIGWFVKPLPGGEHEICLGLEPGVIAGMVMEFPEQKLGTLTIDRVGSWEKQGDRSFGSLDPITFSELVRDLEGLR